MNVYYVCKSINPSWKSINIYKNFQANDLQPRDFSGTADPYAKIRLLPDKTNFWQTKIHKRTLNPSKYN